MQAHDGDLLEALSARQPMDFARNAWRVTRNGFEPLRGSTARGRWNAGSDIEVLYTSLELDRAVAEIGLPVCLQPLWPSRIGHEIHTLRAATSYTLERANLTALAMLGVEKRPLPGF
jgi:hypothetical protein